MDITIITPTFNSDKSIINLINCLNSQTDKRFNWIIQDGGSVDNTLGLVNKYTKINFKLFIEKDYGIYDAINKAISKVETKYYLVVGSDDILNFDCIENYNSFVNKQFDIITSAVYIGNKLHFPKKSYGWLYGMLGIGSSHSVGTLINKNLHSKIGLYSTDFQICADQYFIKQAYLNSSIFYRARFISGKYNLGGFSSSNYLKFNLEYFRIQYLTEKYKLLQLILLNVRLIKMEFKNKFNVR